MVTAGVSVGIFAIRNTANHVDSMGRNLSRSSPRSVTFEEARSVFVDEQAKLIDDPDHSDDEERFILLGSSSALRLLVVCHCYRGNDKVVRIISARKATSRETLPYP